MQTYSVADWKPWEAYSESEITLQEVYDGVPLVSTPAETELVMENLTPMQPHRDFSLPQEGH